MTARVLVTVGAMLLIEIACAAQGVAPDICEIIKRPVESNGRLVKVSGRIEINDKGELRIQGSCLPSVLVAFPENVVPPPAFAFDKNKDWEDFSKSGKRVAFYADIEGRFDWLSDADVATKGFGASKERMRFVLSRISNSHAVVLYRR